MESSAPFLRGVVGVLGLLPSDFFVGEPGTTVKPATCFVRGLDSVDMAALYLLVVEDSRPGVEVSEIMDEGLLGVNGILDGRALAFDDGVAGTGGMAGKSNGMETVWSSVVGVVGLSLRRCRRGVLTRKLLLEVVELTEVEPNLPSARDGARDRNAP